MHRGNLHHAAVKHHMSISHMKLLMYIGCTLLGLWRKKGNPEWEPRIISDMYTCTHKYKYTHIINTFSIWHWTYGILPAWNNWPYLKPFVVWKENLLFLYCLSFSIPEPLDLQHVVLKSMEQHSLVIFLCVCGITQSNSRTIGKTLEHNVQNISKNPSEKSMVI